ncbi:Uncharacterised protein [Streptococcus pneumoniae]|nr:Uncharacterised protein [Streptococcus pneumoniae]
MTMIVIIVRMTKILLQVDMVRANPPSNGAMIVIIPLTTISDVKNLAISSPLNLSPIDAFAITIEPPAVKP